MNYKDSLKTSLEKLKNKFSDLQEEAQDFITSTFQRRQLLMTNSRSVNFLTSLNFDQLINDILNPKMRPKIHRYFLYLLVAIASYAAGKLLALGTAKLAHFPRSVISTQLSDSPLRDLSADFSVIKSANLFNARLDAEENANAKSSTLATNLVCHTSNIKSSLPIKLTNSIVLQNQAKSLVMLELAGEKAPLNLREKELVGSLAEIGRIERQRVVIKNLRTNSCEFLEKQETSSALFAQKGKTNILSPEAGEALIASKKPTGIKNDGRTFSIPKSTRDEMLSKISDVLQQAKATPFKNPDGSLSFKITDVVPGSIYTQLNIRNDDIITAINGKKILDVMEVMNMFGSIKEIDNLNITVRRNGVDETQEFNFE